MNTVRPEHGLRIFSGKGTFHPGRAPALNLRQAYIGQRAPGDLGRGQPTPWDRANRQEPEKNLMMLTCFTQEGTQAKGGVVAFREDLASQLQFCENDPCSPSHSVETFPENNHHRPKVNRTCGKLLPVDVRNAQLVNI